MAGIDSVDFNNTTGVLSIATSDGQTFNKTIGLGANTTDGLAEGDKCMCMGTEQLQTYKLNKEHT